VKTKEELAEIARQNGAKSRSPKTDAGKEQSQRNATTHGDRAAALKHLVPPHSAHLAFEDRREFYKLYDTNIAKYEPMDEHEKAVVREITDLQWSNLRARLAIHTLLNMEILRTGHSVAAAPVIEENRNIENIIAAYDSANKSSTLKDFHKEYAVNTRLIVTLERRLKFIQKSWPAKSTIIANSNEERAFYGAEKEEIAPEPSKGTRNDDPQPIDTKESSPKKRVKVINVQAPLTEEKIRLYKLVFPNRDLRFNVYEPEPAVNGRKEPVNPAPKAA